MNQAGASSYSLNILFFIFSTVTKVFLLGADTYVGLRYTSKHGISAAGVLCWNSNLAEDMFICL